MADIKISELTAALTVSDADVLPMTASGSTVKVSASLLKTHAIGSTDISGVGDGSVTGAIDSLDDEDTAIKAMVAPTETSPTANGWSVGEQFIYNDILYKVTATITAGDALTIGTNIAAADTVAEQIEDATDDISSLQSDMTTAQGNITQLMSKGNWLTGLRFKNLGTSFSAEQATALATGDFSEFWNGDYWIINGVTWRIVDNTGWARRRGDTEFNSPSLIIMPDTNLIEAEAFLIDDSNTATHGYKDCAYRTRSDSKGKSACKTAFEGAFGATHIASHKEIISTGRGANGATGWAWDTCDVELPSEVNIYGHNVWAKSQDANGGGAFNTGDRWGQFMLFRLAPYMAINRSISYWLRDIVGASSFALVSYRGAAASDAPSGALLGLRPYAIVK